MRFDTRKQRLMMLFVWGPLGVLMFGAGGILVVQDEWGLTDGAVIAGAAAGVVVMMPLLVLMLVRQMSRAEARAAQNAYAHREAIVSRWPEWTVWGLLAFSVAVGFFFETAFGAAFTFTVLTLGMIGAWLVALRRKGLFQDTGAHP